jgi:alpha-D-ribose 1-methylphosphonate 5-triphosphate diphosphatase
MIALVDRIEAGETYVSGGVFAEAAPGGPSAGQAIDFDGDLLIPGLVEIHTDNVEKHLSPRDGVDWPAFQALVAHDIQAAGAGITTVCDAVAVGGIRANADRLKHLERILGAVRLSREVGLRAEHWLHLRCELTYEHLLELVDPLLDDPLVRLVSVMDHTPGDRQFHDLDLYRSVYREKLADSDEEFETMIRTQKEAQERLAGPHRQAIAAVCAARGIPLASHDDARAEHVAEALALDARLSEFPTTVEAARAARAAGMAVVAGAPNVIRGGSHSGNISARDLAGEGLVDILSSDYVPVSLLHAPFILAEEVGLPLHESLKMVTANPAAAAGFTDRGRIAPGLRADFIRVRRTADGPVVRGVWREGRRVA